MPVLSSTTYLYSYTPPAGKLIAACHLSPSVHFNSGPSTIIQEPVAAIINQLVPFQNNHEREGGRRGCRGSPLERKGSSMQGGEGEGGFCAPECSIVMAIELAVCPALLS